MTESAVESIHPRYSFDKNPLDPSLLLKLHDVSHEHPRDVVSEIDLRDRLVSRGDAESAEKL